MDSALLDRAACRGHDTNLWFPGAHDLDDAVQARLICAACPVMPECVVGAGDVDGIRGGLSLAERKAHVVPAVALERAQHRAGWRLCVGCDVLFGPKRSTQRYCLTSCRAAAKFRRRYARDEALRERRKAYMVAMRTEEAAKKEPNRRECAARGCRTMFHPYHHQRYCSPRCRKRQKMRRYREAHWKESPMGLHANASTGLHASTIESRGDLELVFIENKYPSGEVTSAWEVNCLGCTENLINTSSEPEARAVLDEPHACPADD